MRRVLENRLRYAAGVVSARRCARPKIVPHGPHARPDTVTSGHAMPSCDRLPVHRSRAMRRVCDCGPPCIVRRRRHTVQTVDDDTRRSISTDRTHDAVHRRAGRRLK
ncbi:hypothetical protein WT24_06740 [Burkholderia sp. MSMB1078WGS]|nr:hypothetical protein WT24_06740 [Burkholderia sp. MSMB1078WGS]